MNKSEKSVASPFVSVVMCAYNGGKFIKQTIDSVLSQTYENFEFIIWNDGSTDSTEEIVKTYKDERIRYFYHENTGLGMALNLACQKAEGEYIARIDADDICLPDRLDRQVKFLDSNKDYALTSSSVIIINELSESKAISFPYTWNKTVAKHINAGLNVIAHPSVMFRTDCYRKTSGYTSVIGFEDILLWMQLIKLGKFHIDRVPLIKYRVLSNSISHTIIGSSYYQVISALLKKMREDVSYSNDDIKMIHELYYLAKANAVKTDASKEYGAEYTLYLSLTRLLGNKTAIVVVSFIKNLYGFFKKI